MKNDNKWEELNDFKVDEDTYNFTTVGNDIETLTKIYNAIIDTDVITLGDKKN